MDAIPAPSHILLPGVGVLASADEESAFFASLLQSNGTTRMTGSGRLADVDAALAPYLPAGSSLEVLDVGISSGISTVEWLLSLEGLGRICTMTAFDRDLYARLYQFGHMQVLAEQNGYLLLIHNGRRAFRRPVDRTGSWNNIVARTAFRLGDVALQLAEAVGAGKRVLLVSQCLRSRPDVRVVEHDIFSPAPDWNGRFHVVRVANLLNRTYFSEPMLRVGLRNASDWVQQGGLLAVARSDTNGQNHATLFRRETSGLRVIHRLCSGSEVETLVNSVE